MSKLLRVGFYATEDGKKPVKDFLEDLKARDKTSYQKVVEKAQIVEEIGYQEACSIRLIHPVEDKISELRIKGTPFRFLGFMADNTLFLLATVDVKKQRKLDPKAIRRAKDAHAEWMARHP